MAICTEQTNARGCESSKSRHRVAATGKETSKVRTSDPRQNSPEIDTNNRSKLETEENLESCFGRHSEKINKNPRPRLRRSRLRHRAAATKLTLLDLHTGRYTSAYNETAIYTKQTDREDLHRVDECEWQRSRKSGCRIAATGKGTSGARNGDPRQNTSKISTNHNKKLEADLKSYSEIGSTHKEGETERHYGRCGKDTRPKPLRTQPRHSELQQFQPRSSQCWRGWYQVKDGENTGVKFSNSTPKNPEPVDTRNNDYSRPEIADNSGHTQTRHSQLRRDLYQRK